MAARTLEDCLGHLRNIAKRMEAAETRFTALLRDAGGLTEEDAKKVFLCYLEAKMARMDTVNGVVSVVHGAYWDRETIRTVSRNADGFLEKIRKPRARR